MGSFLGESRGDVLRPGSGWKRKPEVGSAHKLLFLQDTALINYYILDTAIIKVISDALHQLLSTKMQYSLYAIIHEYCNQFLHAI